MIKSNMIDYLSCFRMYASALKAPSFKYIALNSVLGTMLDIS
jgi:hypothetical protein